MATSAVMSTFKRAEFQGRTDKYAPPLRVGDIPFAFNDVVTGTKPVDVSGAVLTDRYVQDSTSRLARYKHYMRFYAGRHFTVEYNGGDRKTPFNFCRKIVDKRASWIAGKGFEFYSDKGNELVTSVLDSVWAANNKRALVRKTAKASLTTGDCFWYFTVKTTANGKKLPVEKWHVAIHPLNPAYVFPVFTESDPSDMHACMLQFPVWGNAEQSARVFTALLTKESVTYFDNYTKVSEEKNPLGLIPVVHVGSNPFGDSVFGNSILEDIIPLNMDYNDTAQSIRKIIAYHGEPTTLVYGTRLQNMERGANKVWSNLPPPDQCRVENLEMTTDLAATYKHLDNLRDEMYTLGRTPKISFDAEGASVSNTSGIAMQLLFQPLIEATVEEQDQFSIAISKGNKIIASIHKNLFGEDLSALADNEEGYLDAEVVWKSMLPRDEQAEVDLAEKKIAMGIWSRAEAARQLSGVKDTEKLALELAADTRFDIAVAAEKARALKLEKPVFSSSFLSSIFLSEDLLDTASEIEDIADET